MAIPVKYRKSPPMIFNIDYFDYVTKAGFKKFYLLGMKDSTGDTFSLTSDNTSHAASQNFSLSGNGATADFDLTFNNPAVIANADATLNYVTQMQGGNTGVTTTLWTVKHVRGATVTSIGSGTSTSHGISGYHLDILNVTLTRTQFTKGDILRITPLVTYVPGATGSGTNITLDPAGTVSRAITPTNQTASSSSSILIPFEADL